MTPLEEVDAEETEAVHTWFGLSYANYQVLPRSLMQSMPDEWQRRMVGCLRELEDAFAHLDKPTSYLVKARDPITGRFVRETVPHYNRGRTHVARRDELKA